MDNNDTPAADARHIVIGLDSVDGDSEALSWTTDDDTDKGAMVPVQLAGGVWVRVDKEGNVHAGPMAPKHTMGNVKPRTGDSHNRWLGLALITVDHRDIRGDLLALVWQHHTTALPKLIRYGADYMLAAGHDYAEDIRLAAAADALLIVAYGATRGDGSKRFRKGSGNGSCNGSSVTTGSNIKHHRPRRPTLRQREDQFHVRRGSYGLLRDAAEAMYRKRYREAVDRLAKVDNWHPTHYGNPVDRGFIADPLWHPYRRQAFVLGAINLPESYNSGGKEDQPCRYFPAARRAA